VDCASRRKECQGFIAGFSARSQEFADLVQHATEKLRERDRYYYLAYLDVQAHFERMKKHIEGDSAEPTATGMKIAEANGRDE
jgi:hypothetical protein